MSAVKEVRDAANEATISLNQNSISRLLQSDLFNAINDFNGISVLVSCYLLEDRKAKGEKYDNDIEKYINDTLISMRYSTIFTSFIHLVAKVLIFPPKFAPSTKRS